jgi:TM2 domain-containing membrane protein YozV
VALINCPECSKEISDKAGACPQCGCPIASEKPTLEYTLPRMKWDFEAGDFICVKCPKCGKDSKIKKSIAHKTDFGYSLNGEGSCSCGLVFDAISRDPGSSQSSQNLAYYPSRRSTAGLLSLLLGGLGVHHFYLGKPGAGFLFLILCWTFIPAIISLFTAIQYFSMTDDTFNRTVDKSHPHYRC